MHKPQIKVGTRVPTYVPTSILHPVVAVCYQSITAVSDSSDRLIAYCILQCIAHSFQFSIVHTMRQLDAKWTQGRKRDASA